MAGWPSRLLINEANVCRSFSGCRSDRWHILGSVLVRVVGKYQRRIHFDSCLGDQIFTWRESFKFGDAMLQGGLNSWLFLVMLLNECRPGTTDRCRLAVLLLDFPFYKNLEDCFCYKLQYNSRRSLNFPAISTRTIIINLHANFFNFIKLIDNNTNYFTILSCLDMFM